MDYHHRVADVAELYYIRNMKIEEIARNMGASRSTVSRMLAKAREVGIVEFKINRSNESLSIKSELQHRYNLNVMIAATPEDASNDERMLAVGREAALWLNVLVRPNSIIDVAWGTTVEAMSTQLQNYPVRGISIAQMHGSGSIATNGMNYAGNILDRFGKAFQAHVYFFPLPAIFDSAETKKAVWEEKSVQRILRMREKADLLITSVGVNKGDHPGKIYTSFLDKKDLIELNEQKVIGNICSYFFREDGSTINIPLNDRTTGLPFNKIKNIPKRLLIAANPEKAKAIDTILKCRLVTHIVLDNKTAQAVSET